MTTYLIFKDFVTFTSFSYTTNAAGQRVRSATGTDNTIKCAFLYQNTITKTTPELLLQDFIEFIISDDIEPNKDMVVTNLKDRYGHVIEAGPLKITSIKKYIGYTGKLHHYRLTCLNLRDSDC